VAAHRLWATAMMAIFWALALAAVTVVVSIAVRARSWETRHLAWLGSMIFALAAFRSTAPGGPPLGVYMDTAAFLWAEVLIVLSLVALVVLYLTRPRNELE
jgi:predicted membrane channel-forming protein YqfA (hemolysin III family)